MAPLFFPQPANPVQTRLRPVDQGHSVRDFARFRTQLLAAVTRRDGAAVLAALSKDVKLSFGGDTGIATFQKLWKPQAADSTLWATLASTLALGGTFGRDGTFTAPYVFTRWPEDKDPFTYKAVIQSGVRVYQKPNAAAPVLQTLDYAIVALADDQPPDAAWAKLTLPGGRAGFVASKSLRSPTDYRITFAKRAGRWQIVSFVAGD